ncbi:MAG TPA: serine/threonine-protein kinase, partial [Nannocystaceae bacterium]|nr:serine/threonine-protein kinase [Nannocystaceae bacterium]
MPPAADSDATAADGEPAPAAEPASASGTRSHQKFGRYDLLEAIGQGGMGEVYLAYDSKLHRRVAIKLLRQVGANPSHASGVRLLREAQALAQLSHPNLVHVYEVGEHGGEVFLVMEFVAGPSLGQWLKEHKRSSSEILAAFAGAGAGLAAAHRAGIVHRDFKPANVIIGKDGLARVLDFGIAVMGGEHEISAVLGETNARARAAALKASVTERGVVMGTPPYMAPEQHVGARGDARSDQYSFAVALYEALYGVRPFPDDPVARAAAKLRGKLEFPRSETVPSWLRRPLKRAMSVAPAERFASMNELLAALTPGRVQKWVWIGGAAALIVGAITWALLARPAHSGQCDHVPDELGALWNDARREQVRGSFTATEAPYAQASLDLAITALDRYTERWVEIWRASCDATMVARTQSQQLFDLRMDCLERRLDELAATAEVLAAADTEVVRNAAETVSRLTPLAPCTDDDALREELPPPNSPEQRAEIERIRAELARVQAWIYAGRFVLAAERARELADEARALAYAPLEAEAQYVLGEALEPDPKAAEAAYRAAIKAAGAGRHDLVAARAAVALVDVVGVTQVRLAEGQSLATSAEAAVARVGDVVLSARLSAV